MVGGLPRDQVLANPPSPPVSTSYCLPVILNATNVGTSRSFPAQTCSQIHLLNSSLESGFYWIDPNLGCSSDAVLVYCNFTSGETCVFPNSTEVLALLLQPPHHFHLTFLNLVQRYWLPPSWQKRTGLNEPPLWLSGTTGHQVLTSSCR